MPMLLQACLNGTRVRGEQAALPVTPEELAEAAVGALAAGADALHIHPRRADGAQSLGADDQARALAAIRARLPHAPVGVSTAAWIEPNQARRLALVRGWVVRPDFASVNLAEPGALDLCAALLERGVGVEAGLASEADARLLLASGLAPRCLRILIEPGGATPEESLATAERIIAALDSVPSPDQPPRLLHGADAGAWPVLRAALARGYDTRIGFEDTLTLPDGAQARSNAELVTAAHRLMAPRL